MSPATGLAQLATVMHVARFILAQPARDADVLGGGIRRSDLPEDFANRRFVIEISHSQGAPAYIVGDHGTFTTRTRLPDWASDADVVRVRQRLRAGNSLLAHLRHATEELRSTRPDLFDGMRVQETLEAVERHYGASEPQFNLEASLVMESLTSARIVELLESPAKTRSWARRAFATIRDEALELRLSIPAASPAIATLGLYANMNDPRMLLGTSVLNTIQPGIDLDDVVALASHPVAVAELVREAEIPYALGLVYDIGLYLLAAELAGGGAFSGALYVANTHEVAGDRAIKAASRTTSLQLFYSSLALGLLYFRAADRIYAFLERFSRHARRSEPLFPDLGVRRVICEERRALILSSLSVPVGLKDRMNPVDPGSVGKWIDLLSTMAIQDAKALAHDFTLRLVIPMFMRELIVGSVYRIQGDAELARDTLIRVLEQLEADEERNRTVPADLDFRPAVMLELAAAYDVLGESEMAKHLRHLADERAAR